MLGKNIDITDHQRNIQVLITELFKIMNNFAPQIMEHVYSSSRQFQLKKFPGIGNRGKGNCQI